MVTAITAPNQIMTMSGWMPSDWPSAGLKASTIGKKIGRNTRMIAGHSNGHPSRNSSTTTNTSIITGDSGSASIRSVTQVAVPRRENTAPKMFEVTASSSTMLEVAVVESTACRAAA